MLAYYSLWVFKWMECIDNIILYVLVNWALTTLLQHHELSEKYLYSIYYGNNGALSSVGDTDIITPPFESYQTFF
jgi:hypothetical protein